MDKKADILLAFVMIFLVAGLLFLQSDDRDKSIAKDREIERLKTELDAAKKNNVKQAMIIEGYENRLSKFHISNLEQVGLPKKEDK